MKTGNREGGTATTRLGDGVTRRVVVAGLASLAAAPKQSSAQQALAKIPRVGWIWLGGRSAGNSTELTGFRQGLMFYPENPATVRSLAQAEEVGGRLGLVIRPFPVRDGDELEAAISAVAREGVDGVDIEPVAPFTTYPQQTGELLLKYRVPAVSELRRIAESGELLSYGPNLLDATRRLAYFVDRILRGATPADLPVEQASRLELVVNMKTAAKLGLTIPPSILARADEIIE